MRLGIITDCIHYKHPDGRVGTENHILLRQFEQLSSYFTNTTVACAFAKWDESKVITWYNRKFDFIDMPVVGGMRFIDKLKIILTIPKWFGVYKKINKCTDILYQRFPNNVNLPGFFYFYFLNKKVFATFTGTWPDYTGEPKTYRFQKWLLRKLFKGPVWVYTSDQSVDKRIIPGYSPSYTLTEWNNESERVELRKQRIQEQGLPVLRLISVGTLIYYKNQLSILKACVILKKKNIAFTLTIVGDGPMYKDLENFIVSNSLQKEVFLVGKKKYEDLKCLYQQSDFVVQAPLKEGFGKVPIEGFFHGVIPVLSNLSMASYMTGGNERGFLFENGNEKNIAEVLAKLQNKIHLLPSMIDKGRKFVKNQTLESWAKEYYETISEYYKIP